MTKTFSFQACCFAMLFGAMTIGSVSAQSAPTVIRIGTQNTDLILQVADNGRLYQTYFGDHLLDDADINQFSWNVLSSSDGSMSDRGWEVYSCNGNEDYFEPALSVIHNDGNRTTYLYYQNHKQTKVAGGVQTDIVQLVTSGFRITTDETSGTDIFTAVGGATVTHDDTTGADVFSF